MDYGKRAIALHEKLAGKLAIVSKTPVNDMEQLSLAYTPGVAEVCLEIRENPDRIYDLTSKGNMVAVVTDGSAVLGLGNIGARASLPVMEGKAVLFKEFGGVDAFPVLIESNDVETIVDTVKLISGNYGGINLEDISAPRCFEIEERLKAELEIPVFHDDQHGTAVVVLAGLINALKLKRKSFGDLDVVVNGSGAAGIAITKLLLSVGVGNIVVCDTRGAIFEGREGLNSFKEAISKITNLNFEGGSIHEVIKGKDVFIGVSKGNLLDETDIEKMNPEAIVFAMANPVPEISPDLAKKAGALIVGTGRSDYPNQVNNVLAFPGIFRGALDIRAKNITEEMKIAAAYGIAESIDDSEISADYILPKPFDKNVLTKVSEAVKKAYLK
ncbi:MAG: NADP-dependent malic enzyme [Clostridiales bacterium]|nr:NADP-dependent malic enzyme [Clostridiales bacterium]